MVDELITLLFTACLGFALGTVDHLDGASDGSMKVGRSLTDQELRMGEEAGYSYVDRLAQLEEDLYAQGIYVKEDSHLYRMSQFKRPTQEAIELSKKSLLLVEATRALQDRLGLTNEDFGSALMRAELRNTVGFTLINSTCLVPPVCKPSKYRSMDGSCNNLAVTNLGKSSTDYRRLVAPAYADGIQQPRSLSTTGSPLPSARLISTNVFSTADHPQPSASLSLVQFGQFLNHDLESTTQFTFANGTGIKCCSDTKGPLPPSQINPACLPIQVPTNDKFLNKKTVVQTCMNFVRSITGPRINCSQALGYADQLNSNTHWLDGSPIYGSNDATMKSLRANTGGLLLMSTDKAFNGQPRSLLPVAPGCTNGACFFAGDSRVTEQPQLTVMHTLWAREHNRVAKALAALNPTWSDESLFQEARRIVIAELQHVTFNEFLPSLLGTKLITKFGLAPLTTGYLTKYNSLTSGPVSNEFATAAFRMGHTLAQGFIQLFDENGNLLPTSYNMSSTFNDASKIVNDKTFLDSAIRGLSMEPAQRFDRYFSRDLWLKLFKEASEKFGFDLVALNIQRGRDHGLPSYNTYRQLCGFSKLTSFDQMINPPTVNDPVTSINVTNKIRSVYATVDDIDLYTGGITEHRGTPTGGIIGPTFSCLIGENFAQIKYGDRFFYERGGQPHSFTAAQLDEIRKASLARIYCDNNDGSILRMQPKVFGIPDISGNAKVLCSNTAAIPRLDLSLWKGETLF